MKYDGYQLVCECVNDPLPNDTYTINTYQGPKEIPVTRKKIDQATDEKFKNDIRKAMGLGSTKVKSQQMDPDEETVLKEARFGHEKAMAARQKLNDLGAQYRSETDYKKKQVILWKIRTLRNNLALAPNQSYDMYT
jgi:hypothetical protein